MKQTNKKQNRKVCRIITSFNEYLKSFKTKTSQADHMKVGQDS